MATLINALNLGTEFGLQGGEARIEIFLHLPKQLFRGALHTIFQAAVNNSTQ